MARRRARAPLDAFLNGRLVGGLQRDASGAFHFQYAQEWLAWDATFPISLSLPLRETRYSGDPVFNVFDNLLPDETAIRRRIAERVGAEGSDAFSLLTALGRDCVGALQFLPEGADPGRAGGIEAAPLDDGDIARILANLEAAPLGVGEDEAFRISIAGAQEKTALLRRDGRWLKPVGMTATTHILKPQIGRLANGIDLSASVENEYLCMKLVAALGVPAAEVEIADFGDLRTLVVERFDRLWTRDGRLLRLAQEDCCQALSVPPTRKYQADGGPGVRDILSLLKGSDAQSEDIAVFMRACIVFWLLGATDGHAKNFSIRLMPGGRFRMTPVYDVLSAQPSLDTRRILHRQFKLAMSVGKSRHYAVQEIAPRHFLETAEQAGVGRNLVISIMEDLHENAKKLAASVFEALPRGFPDQLISSLEAGIAARARRLVVPEDTSP